MGMWDEWEKVAPQGRQHRKGQALAFNCVTHTHYSLGLATATDCVKERIHPTSQGRQTLASTNSMLMMQPRGCTSGERILQAQG